MQARLSSSLLILLLLLFPSVNESNAQERTTSGSASLSEDGTVRVDNHEGRVVIETWDRNEVKYRGVVTPEPDAEHPEATVVRVDRSSSRILLRTEYDDSKEGDDGFWGNGKNIMPVEYHLTIPRAARVEIDDHESTIEATAIQGSASIETHDGSISVSKSAGAVQLDAHDGPVHVDNHGGELRIDTHDSTIRLRSIEGLVEIDAHDGDIDATALQGGLRVDTHGGGGRLSFSALRDDIQIDTHDGDFILTVPGRAEFDLHTNFDDDADLRSDFDLSDIRVSDEDGDEINFIGEVNGGGPRISLTTHDGSFEIRTEE